MSDTAESTPRDPAQDEVLETTKDPHLGVKVETVLRNGYEEDVEYTKIYGKRKNRYGTLTGEGSQVIERHVLLAEFPTSVSTEVLFGLAEAHGYDLEEK